MNILTFFMTIKYLVLGNILVPVDENLLQTAVKPKKEAGRYRNVQSASY